MGTLKTLIILAILAYAGVLGLMYVFQRSLMYFPDRARTPPAAAGLSQVQEVILKSTDGENLIAWYMPPQESKPLVIYFHGNGGALNLRADRFRWLTADGFGLLALSYRGYGGSTGKPTEAGMLLDAMAAYDFAATRYPSGRIVLWGESLGTGVAVALAADRQIGGLILDAPFTSAVDIGAAAYPFLPVRWFMKDSFRSNERIGRVKAPLLVLHGEQDHIVPIAFGERLFALANEPKKMARFPSGGHVNLDDHGAAESARSFLNGLTGATQ
jgi:fermentation-respiration switch protein FrsA (DUF1100 family)